MTFSMNYAFSENYILAYSHDEVVHGKASLIGKIAGDYDDKFASLRVLFAWLFAHPGKKLMFMGNEFAQFIEWNYKQELDWGLLDYDKHRGIKDWVKALNNIYAKRPALHASDGGWEGFTWLNVDDRKNSVFAFMRTFGATAENADGSDAKGTDHVVCVFNFTPVAHRVYDIALPSAGTLSLILNSDGQQYGGAPAKVKKTVKARKKELNGFEYSAALTLPPMCALYYSYRVIYTITEKSGR
jgi:1,4-alpha-glucan branching enzyme